MVSNAELADKIAAYDIDIADVELPFSKRLARDNDWSDEFSERVIEEYKKFIYLMATNDDELTPSDEVDQAWHLHLVYTRDYWQNLCDEVIGKSLHHGPTQGGSNEKKRYANNYNTTLKLYQKVFGHRPPKDIWPSAWKRFSRASMYRRINLCDYYIEKGRIIQRFFSQRFWGAVIMPTLITTAIYTLLNFSNEPYLSASNFFELYFYTMATFILPSFLSVFTYIIQSPSLRHDDDNEASGGCGGCGG